VYLTMTYEYVSGTAEGYRQIKPVWLDLGRGRRRPVPRVSRSDMAHT
jgi:hypothetical protein